MAPIDLSDFKHIGRYQDGAFEIEPSAGSFSGVYVWAHRLNGGLIPRRVGIACGKQGVAKRYRLYNRWLAGLFKPDNAREQQVRRLTLQGLGNEAEVLYFPVVDKSEALALEARLGTEWQATLTSDMMVADSWIKQAMKSWRSTLKPAGEKERAGPMPKKADLDSKPDKWAHDIEAVARAFLNTVRRKSVDGSWVRGIDAFNAAIAECKDLGWVAYTADKPKARSALTSVIRKLMVAEYPDVEIRKDGPHASSPVFYRVTPS